MNQKFLLLQSSFQRQESNIQFRIKCLKPIDDPNINPYFANVKYCINESCYNRFFHSWKFDLCDDIRNGVNYYEDYISFKYCNHIGVDQMHFLILILINWSTHLKSGMTQKKIFSKKETQMSLSSVTQNTMYSNQQISTTNYDSVEIKNILFTLDIEFILENTNNKVDITLKNVIFIQSNFSDGIIMKTQQYNCFQ